jgi:hypothetical protein
MCCASRRGRGSYALPQPKRPCVEVSTILSFDLQEIHTSHTVGVEVAQGSASIYSDLVVKMIVHASPQAALPLHQGCSDSTLQTIRESSALCTSE